MIWLMAALGAGLCVALLAGGAWLYRNHGFPPGGPQTGHYVTAAINWKDGKAQFFLNDGRYFRYDIRANRTDPGYPKPIDEKTWPGMAQYSWLIAAACKGPDGKVYFFLSDGRFLRYDIQGDRMEAGYPKPLDDDTWPGMGQYASTLSSALDWKGGKIQFFLKNGQYIRYDVATYRADESYPKDITESTWPGLASYKHNLAGMINWDDHKAYMFLKSGQYLRYDIQADRVDPGYPKAIDDDAWPAFRLASP